MPYLIDGNNLCGAARDRRLGLPTDEAEMVLLLADFAWLTGATGSSMRRCERIFETLMFP